MSQSMSDMTAPQTEQGVPLLQDGIDGEASAGGFQKWKYALPIAAIVIAALSLIGTIVLVVVLPRARQPNIGMEDWTAGIGLKTTDYRFSPDSTGMVYMDKGVVYKFHFNQTSSQPIVDTTKLEYQGASLKYFSWEPSFDAKLILFGTNYTKQWRHSFFGDYLVYNVQTKEFMPVGYNKTINPTWAPSSYSLAFGHGNNMFVQDFTSPGLPVTQITQDGLVGSILNGVQGWLYEEEVFEDTKAIWWAPDSSKVAFIRTDESHVEEFWIPTYLDINVDPYQTFMKIKYPKSGTPNPKATISVYNVKSGGDPVSMMTPNEYITGVTWKSTSEIAITTLADRVQQHEVMYICDVATGASSVSIETDVAVNGWVSRDVAGPVFLTDKEFAVVRNNSNYKHIAFTRLDGSLRWLTSGNWDVLSIVGHSTESLYFLAYPEGPLETHLFKVDLDGSHMEQITTSGSTWSASFCADGSYYMLQQQGPSVPVQYIRSTIIPDYDIVWQRNEEAKANYDKFYLPEKEFIKVPVNGVELNGFMVKPPNFSPSTKYPVVMTMYGGPGSIRVSRGFSFGYNEFLASNLSVIVVCVDNRGTGGRGIAFEQATYKRLGILEVEDQIAVANWLPTQYNFVDASRIGLWGWSYGGFMTTSVLTRSTVLKTAIAVAPVTDWRLYDTAYTERYMQTPQLNPEGYSITSVLQNAGNITQRFMLIHGTGDDNVHFQNSAELVKQLIPTRLQFDVMYYPNRDHSINTDGATYHIYTLMTNYWKDHLVL